MTKNLMWNEGSKWSSWGIFNQMWITMEKYLRFFLLCNYKNKYLNLLITLNTKPFFNQYFIQWWCKTSHMQTLKHQWQFTVITTLVDCLHNIQCNMIEMTPKDGWTWPLTCEKWHGHIIMHMVLLKLTNSSF